MSGHKRWYVAQKINLSKVPVRIEKYNSEIEEREAFIDYNRYREKTFTQMLSEAEFIEETEKIKAKERQLSQLKKGEAKPHPVRETFPERETGRTRDKVASQIGIGSGKQYDKAKEVWDTAKAGDEEAQKWVKKLDKKDATINKAYSDIKKREKKVEAKKQAEEKASQYKEDTNKHKLYHGDFY